MSRRAAIITQAEVARAIRAAQQTGLTIVRIVVRKDGVSIETVPESRPQDQHEMNEWDEVLEPASAGRWSAAR